VNFEEYLLSKKIDSQAFRAAEEGLWESWRKEFEEISPVGFTAQKLFLINPIRRKYPAKIIEKPQENSMSAISPSSAQKTVEELSAENEKPAVKKPSVPRPVFKPKPKPNE
jgi:hypothetical protein